MKKLNHLIIILILTNLIFFSTTVWFYYSRERNKKATGNLNVNLNESIENEDNILPEGPSLSQVLNDQEIKKMISNWKTFKNERDGYEILYPTDWVKEGPLDNLTGTISGSSSVTQVNFTENYDSILFPFGYSSVRFIIQIFSIDPIRTLESIVFEKEGIRDGKEKISDFNYLSMDNNQAIQYYIDNYNVPEPHYSMNILIRKDDKIYEIEALVRNKQEYGEYRGIFEAMVSTFKFL